jgi:peptidoglycan/xylan/chitin deacetylase (PgdA/CDA1 family)
MTNHKNKELIKLFIAAICYYLGLFRIVVIIKKHKPITYHNIINDEHFDNAIHLGVSHSESVFRRHVSVLTKYFNPKNLQFTFDDGYLNNLTVAVPILDEFNLKGLFFVPLEKEDKSEALWVDRTMFLFSYCSPGSYIFSKIRIQIDDNKRSEAFGELFKYVESNYSELDTILSNVEGYLRDQPSKISENYYCSRFTFINDLGIKTMFDSGHKIGFHSINHHILSKKTLKDINNELIIVTDKLKSYEIIDFSFPFGQQDDINFEAVKLLHSFGLTNLYSNVDKKMEKGVISRRSIGQTQNKYLILAYYLNIF